MGCGGSTVAPAPDDPPPVGNEYDERWDKYRLAKFQRHGDGKNVRVEPSRFRVSMMKKMAAIRAWFIILTTGISYSLRPAHKAARTPSEIEALEDEEPETPRSSASDDDSISHQDKSKIEFWLSSLPFQRLPPPSQASFVQDDFTQRGSIHTIYSQDEEEELPRAPSQTSIDGITPQRLTDKRCINRLQVQLRQKERRNKKQQQPRGAGSPLNSADDDFADPYAEAEELAQQSGSDDTSHEQKQSPRIFHLLNSDGENMSPPSIDLEKVSDKRGISPSSDLAIHPEPPLAPVMVQMS